MIRTWESSDVTRKVVLDMFGDPDTEQENLSFLGRSKYLLVERNKIKILLRSR